MREYLKSLELEEGKTLPKEIIDKIMAEYGKQVNSNKDELQELKDQNESLSKKVKSYETKITDLNSKIEENSSAKQELDELKQSIEEEKEKAEADKKDKTITSNILKAIEDKKFVNDYTKNSIVSEVKKALGDENNVGKSIKDLFDEITKDKEGIFENPNKPADMTGANDNVFKEVDKEAFNKMGYKERVELKAENPELFEKLNNSKE